MKSNPNLWLWKISEVLGKAFVGKIKMRLANECCSDEQAGKKQVYTNAVSYLEINRCFSEALSPKC